MSRRNGPKIDLKLNPSAPPRSPSQSPPATSPTSPPTSCVSSDDSPVRYSTSPEGKSMMLVGCPRCLMYVMLADEDPKCPKCKSTVLLDVIHDDESSKARKNKKN